MRWNKEQQEWQRFPYQELMRRVQNMYGKKALADLEEKGEKKMGHYYSDRPLTDEKVEALVEENNYEAQRDTAERMSKRGIPPLVSCEACDEFLSEEDRYYSRLRHIECEEAVVVFPGEALAEKEKDDD